MAVYNSSGTTLKCIKAVAHRGYSTTAPENTIPAYQLALDNGYTFVECDISFTSDGVPMLLHDSTIDRTSDGSGTLSEMTYDEVRQYDFGSWKSSDYAGTVIPTLAEFLQFCASNNLHPYLELKQNGSYTESQIQGIVDMVEQYGMTGKVSYISFSLTYLQYVRDYDAYARLGYVVSSVSSTTITNAEGLRTGYNNVFIDSSSYGSTVIGLCSAVNMPLEVWTLSSITSAASLDDYITGATANGGLPSAIESYQECYDQSGAKMDKLYNTCGLL